MFPADPGTFDRPQKFNSVQLHLGATKMLRRGFVVEVQVDHLIVRVTGTSYVASFYRVDDATELVVRHVPLRDDHRAPMSRLDFIRSAWQLAQDKAHELKWIA
jgi:hypothetical protein